MNAQELTILLESPVNFGKIIKGQSGISLFASVLLSGALILVLLGLKFVVLIPVGIVLAVIGFACFLAGKLVLDAKATKKSSDRYYNATEHRVCPQLSLKDYIHENKDGDKSKYAILAFRTDGTAIPPQTVAELRTRIAGVDISTVRYESAGYPKLELIRGKGEALTAQDNTIFALASDMDGLYIYPLAYDKADDNSPFVVYASTGGDVYIYPLMEKHLAKLG
jgi:uncharacterized membrane protein YbaN (DUF454 family)